MDAPATGIVGIAKGMKKQGRKGKLRFWFKWVAMVGLVLSLIVMGLGIYANVAPVWVSRGKIFSDVNAVPPMDVGLVFGTTDRIGDDENLYFRYRMEAAESLWKAGKVKTFLVSGDNRSQYYNEPEKMRSALIARGIPKDRIECDYAGLRTLDSVVRAKKVFGVHKVLFITQRFQVERGMYIAQAKGIEAYGFEAEDVLSEAGRKTKIREVGARVKMWLDVHFLKTEPRHLGERMELPKRP
jgi:SanA protein